MGGGSGENKRPADDLFSMSSAKVKKLTSEELLIEEIKRKRELKMKLKEKRQKYYENKVVKGEEAKPEVTALPPTQILAFSFMTDKRVKSAAPAEVESTGKDEGKKTL